MMDAPHGGDIYAYDRDLLDFSVNLNPLGMPDRVLRAIREHAEEYDRYPDPHCRALRRALSVRESAPEKRPVFGNGAADLIVRLCMVLKPKRRCSRRRPFPSMKRRFGWRGARSGAFSSVRRRAIR